MNMTIDEKDSLHSIRPVVFFHYHDVRAGRCTRETAPVANEADRG